MNIIDFIKTRRCVREYLDKSIAKSDLIKIVDAGRFAPSARAVDPWEFIVITDKDILKSLSDATDNGRFISNAAACIIVFCADTKYYLEDGSAATENILLAAQSLGIGACWVAGDKKPYTDDIKRILNVPKEYRLVSIVPLGYPARSDAFKVIDTKRALEKIIHWEGF